MAADGAGETYESEAIIHSRLCVRHELLALLLRH